MPERASPAARTMPPPGLVDARAQHASADARPPAHEPHHGLDPRELGADAQSSMHEFAPDARAPLHAPSLGVETRAAARAFGVDARASAREQRAALEALGFAREPSPAPRVSHEQAAAARAPEQALNADMATAHTLPSAALSSGACPACRAPALPGMRFCRECGTAIIGADTALSEPQAAEPLQCWRCQGEREPQAAFCRFCGAAFHASPHETALAVARPDSSHVAPRAALSARLVTLLKDGSEGRAIALEERDADIGTSEGEVTFPDDPYMSARHARIACRSGAYILVDLDSVNGVYVRLREEVELRDRDLLLMGQQVLRFELLGEGELSLGPAWQRGVLVFGTPEAARFARLVQYTTEGVGRDVHYLFRDETVIGRENGDIVFTDDPFLSRRHAVVRADRASRRFTLHDLGSSNGTALRIRGEHVLRDGDQFRIGRHLFRFEAGPTGGRAGR